MRSPRDTPRGQGALQPSYTGYTAPRTVTTSTPTPAQTLAAEPAPVVRTIPPRGPSNNPAPATNTVVNTELERAGSAMDFSGLGGSYTPQNFASRGATSGEETGYLIPALILGAFVLFGLLWKMKR